MTLSTSMPYAAPRKPGRQRLLPAAHVTLSQEPDGGADILTVDSSSDSSSDSSVDSSVERVQEPALEVFALGPVQQHRVIGTGPASL